MAGKARPAKGKEGPTELVRIAREDRRKIESLKQNPRETVGDVVHLALEAYQLKARPLPSEARA